VRFSLQDIKKQVHRRGGELYVGLHFLRPGELRPAIERLITYHEQMIGQPRRQFSQDEARACVGDYRMAHCLIATLSAWYQWQQRAWPEVFQHTGSESQKLLENAGITSPIHLRLALYDYVNQYQQGFLDARGRTDTLQKFVTPYQLSVSDLEYLLVLDSDDEEVLTRDTPRPPSAQDVATLYNQWAFESALFNASSVRFIIDCNAFEHAQSGTDLLTGMAGQIGTGIGTVVKRLCYLARRLGVYYDLTFDSPSANTAALLHLTLYGPQEMTGAPQQYGMRLARLCRLLLGYGSSPRQDATISHERNKQKRRSALTNAIVEAEATVHFLQRSYCFAMDQILLSLLPPIEATPGGNVEEPLAHAQRGSTDAPSIFDSSIEQSFTEAFIALQNSNAVEGWQLIREPEPLMLGHSIFIPDFALTRQQKRVYVEILGFWTPSYRERKMQKLQQLRNRGDIVLAIPEEAREAFASIAHMFPIAWYTGQLSATELIKLLRKHYDDFAERLASIDSATVRQRVQAEGFLPERLCYELLHVYRRSELPQAAERVSGQGVTFSPGIGLYQVDWMEQLRTSFVLLVGILAVPSLADVLREARTRWPSLVDCEDSTIEAMLGLWPEVRVRRSSIFEATVEIVKEGEGQLYAINNEETPHSVPAKKSGREKRTIPKKRAVKEAAQGDLWN
jgi:predicted nuclease of restriction endonuclease-like RecB superfamily